MRRPVMHLASRVRRSSRARSFVAASLLAVAAACADRATGPAPRYELQPIQPVFLVGGQPAPFPDGVLRLILRTREGATVVDTALAITDATQEIRLTLRVTVPTSTSELFASALVVASSGDTLLRADSSAVAVRPIGSTLPDPAPLAFTYVGPGANAARVQLVPVSGTGFSGDTVVLQASVRDAANAVIPNVPIIWTSSDTSLARVTSPFSGRVVLRSARGPVRLFARTYTDLADSTLVVVSPLPSLVEAVDSGDPTDTVGAAMQAPLRVRLRAADGLPVAGIAVRFTAPSAVRLADTLVVSDAAGIASVAATLDSVAGVFPVTATARRGSGSLALNVRALPDAPVALETTGLPTASLVAGTALGTVTARVRDRFSNTVITYADSVQLRVVDVGGADLVPALRRAPAAGLATFTGSALTLAGTGRRVEVSAGTLPLVQSTAFAVLPAPATRLVLAAEPSATATAGTSVGAVVVQARDPFNNLATGFTQTVTVAFAANPGAATLGGTLSRTAVAGEATFNDLQVTRAAAGYSLVTSAATLTPDTSIAFAILPAAASALELRSAPVTNTTAGVSLPALVVGAVDVFGNDVPTFAGPVDVALSSNPTTTTLLGTTTRAATAGEATFNDLAVTAASAGYVLTATSTGLTSVVAAAFTVDPGAAAVLTLSSAPITSVVAGTTFTTVTVVARDAFGNVATGFTAPVNVALGTNPSGATLAGTQTAAAVAGVATFTDLALQRTGAGYTFDISAGGLPTLVTDPFTITAAPASALVVTTQPPATTIAGDTLTPIEITAQDAFGNVVPTYTGTATVALSANPSGAPLGGTLSVNAVAGVVTLQDISITTAASGYTLLVSASGLTPVVSTPFAIVPAAASDISLVGVPAASTVAGQSMTPIVAEVVDRFGNLVPSFGGVFTVTLSTNPTSTTLNGTLTVNPVAGVATFADLSLTVAAAGYRITVAAPGLISSTTGLLGIAPAPASVLEILTAPPTSLVAGAPLAPLTARALDPFGNVATGFTGTVDVDFADNASGATLQGTTSVSAAAGLVSFADLLVTTAGSAYTVALTAPGLTPDTTAAFDVVPDVPARLAFLTEPSVTTAGQSLGLVEVEVHDQFGNLTASTDSVFVEFALSPDDVVLLGTTGVAALAGNATFSDLQLNNTGAYALRAFTGTLVPDTSAAFTITPDVPVELVFNNGPDAGAVAGSPFSSVTVRARDQFGNLATQFSDTMFLSLLDNPGAAALYGTTFAQASGGLATFTGTVIGRSGTGYSLRVEAAGLDADTSGAFDVGAPTVEVPREAISVASMACALRSDNVGVCWGGGSDATYRGDGTSKGDHGVPTPIVGALTLQSIHTGSSNASCALTTSGQAYCWGINTSGILGQGNFVGASTVPVAVTGGLTFAHMDVGSSSSACGVTAAGALYCWGANASGMLGSGGTANLAVPTLVAGLPPVASVTAGFLHTCALDTTGRAYCWGDNASGQLGDGTTTQRLTATPVAAGYSFVALSAGFNHTCGLTSGGRLFCWGANASGQLGTGAAGALSSVPVPVLGSGQYAAIHAGTVNTCAVRNTGSVECWGSNAAGQLGDGSFVQRDLPTPIASADVFSQVSVGCGLTTAGALRCWGQNAGHLIDGAEGLSPTLVSGGFTFTNLAAARNHSCGVLGDGSMRCWGLNSSGQLGNGEALAGQGFRNAPVAVVSAETFASAWPMGGQYSCGINTAQAAFCWGLGSLGDGSGVQQLSPVPIAGGLSFSALAGGLGHACGVTTAGAGYCWGTNTSGALGDGTFVTSTTPVAVSGGLTFGRITIATSHSCALTTSGAAYCWGLNSSGQLGIGSAGGNSNVPLAVAGGRTFVRISAAGASTCGVESAGAVYCWGGTYGTSPTALPGGFSFTEITGGLSSGGDFFCALTAAGAPHCWGANNNSNLGDRTTTNSTAPVAVAGGLTLSSVSAGFGFACGLTPAGAAYCWGRDPFGQRGLGTPANIPTPTPIAGGNTYFIP